VHATVHRPDVDEGMRVVGSGADDGVDIFLFEALSPVLICFSFGELIGGFCEVFGVDVT
jgi:hypothetical protein